MKILILLALTISLGITSAYADTLEIETSFPVVSLQCEEVLDEDTPRGHCKYKGQDAFIGGDGESYAWNPVDGKYTLIDDLIEDTEHLLIESQIESIIPEPTIIQRTIANYEKGDLTDLERQIISLLEKKKSVCLVDVLTIQTYGELQVPIDQFTDEDGSIVTQLVKNYMTSSLNMLNHPLIAGLLLDIDACRAQESLREITGVRYDNMVVDDENTIQFTHRDAAAHIEPIGSPQLTKDDFKQSLQKANDAICNNHLFAENLKIDSGCYPDVAYHGSSIAYQSDAEDAYQRYLNNGDTEQLYKIQRALLDKSRDSYK